MKIIPLHTLKHEVENNIIYCFCRWIHDIHFSSTWDKLCKALGIAYSQFLEDVFKVIFYSTTNITLHKRAWVFLKIYNWKLFLFQQEYIPIHWVSIRELHNAAWIQYEYLSWMYCSVDTDNFLYAQISWENA